MRAAIAVSALAAMLVLFTWPTPASSQSPQPEALNPADLSAAMTLWTTNGPSSYQWSYQSTLQQADAPPAVYTVVSGTVTVITQPDDNPDPITAGQTVDDMFAAIQAGLTAGHDVTATFDSTDGHPTTYQISVGKPFVDPVEAVQVTGLVATTTPLRCDDAPATMLGTPGPDMLRGSTFDDVIVALGGDDTVIGGGGDDIICGGHGNDTIVATLRSCRHRLYPPSSMIASSAVPAVTRSTAATATTSSTAKAVTTSCMATTAMTRSMDNPGATQ